jgi:hypothetical protein
MLQFPNGNNITSYWVLRDIQTWREEKEEWVTTDCDIITITICKYTHKGLLGTSQHTNETGTGIPYVSEYKKIHLRENPYIYISQLLCHFVLLA